MFEVKVLGGFAFLGSCASKAKTCDENDITCESIEEVANSECRVKGSYLNRFWFYHPGPVKKDNKIRLKVYVKNPRYPVLIE